MSGCELRKCPDYKDKKCLNTLDYVNKYTGEQMCPYNDDAMPKEEWNGGEHQ